jgi:hypothetical protein
MGTPGFAWVFGHKGLGKIPYRPRHQGFPIQSVSDTGPRPRFKVECVRFPAMRRSFDARVGRVAMRAFGFTDAARSKSASRASASRRFASCVRKRPASITSTSSPLTRRPAIRRNRAFTSAGSVRLAPMSKRSSTAVETLLTFCPPGPDARTCRNSNSASGIGK